MKKEGKLWQKVWEERGESFPVDDLIALDGYDYGLGKLTSRLSERLFAWVKDKTNLKEEHVFLEVGCGAGMMLEHAARFVNEAYGVDYAKQMINRGRRLFPTLELLTAEAGNLPFKDKMFDRVFSFSIFQYFPDLDYTKQVLNEMIRVVNSDGIIFIGDIPDEDKRKECEIARQKSTVKPQWSSSVKDKLIHSYYDPVFFTDFFNENGFKCEICPHELKDFVIGPYRFNIIAQGI